MEFGSTTLETLRKDTMSRRFRRVLAMIGVATIATAGLTIPANAAPDGSAVVINEVYGGGGNSGAYYTHDFVELYNPTSAPIAVAGFQIKYSGANGNLGNTTTLPADATIQPGSYYLVQMAKGSGGTAPLPAPDFTGGAAMAGANGIVELTDGTTIIDTVGYGSTATRFETAPTAPLSNSTSAGRTVPGVDTDNNAADFTVGAPTPTSGPPKRSRPSFRNEKKLRFLLAYELRKQVITRKICRI